MPRRKLSSKTGHRSFEEEAALTAVSCFLADCLAGSLFQVNFDIIQVVPCILQNQLMVFVA